VIPLRFEIERLTEDFDPEAPVGVIVKTPPPPRYRVTATLLDADRSAVVSYEFHSMVDRTRDAYERFGSITHSDVSGHLEHLRRVRDEINELLGES
jgi:hypothetical protein